ncbi:DUF6090 family protein [Algoriphagus halophilus]|uniref:Uncharacterized protein n=1 Tax=Algoriphagus halophilus TaxID=226505 RepID=A0A1N6G2B3_9BACT|nr:DUF6090 family protein [Algoriphagus halophilus]SIO01630.1 hypothetical protein SAMN05444394_2912 [Algoriphagus halophilus]
MLKFFRVIRKQLIEQNKARTYILYAIGETFLVVIGILIALQVNNWNEERKDRKREIDYLYRILSEIERDSASLHSSINLTSYKVEQGKRLLSLNKLDSNLPDSAQFIWDIFLIGRGGSYSPYIPAYQELVSTGEVNVIYNKTIIELLEKYLNRTNGLESFVYREGEQRRTEYNKFIQRYFSALIMDSIWDLGRKGISEEDLDHFKSLGIDIEGFRNDANAGYQIRSMTALNMELSRLYRQNMDTYLEPLLAQLRDEINSLVK